MLCLALNYGNGQMLLKDIARIEDISEKYLSQIIIPLKAAGLVSSLRGAKGGYILAKPASQITLKEIVEALEGSLDLVDCIANPFDCPRVSICVARDLWMEMGMQMNRTLKNITLADLVKRCREKEENAVMYNI